MIEASTPSGKKKQSNWYVAFAWFLAFVWVLVLVWAWLNYESWPTWAKIAMTIALVLTTPAGSDLFMFVRLWRVRRKSQTET